ncbi:hypothetical protein RhiirA5_348235 [Rhizophagus irregularis]|uniref:Uncharacterized protein n=2 Tax=Rhizophagus irregularis TaxID=588596 RepID=U9SG17_RHIID|nr:hypothetical protein GLOIN_2v1514951 [Rhizophagus irregularis DAOM 181602=DAOM 197198]PKC16036.1 hypothetical protein RhiirA5_348235 [Rhizophagus irregularis]PKC74346.1 hypothetical protein RhiirA1_409330 [Rhizophagus irregularis]PKK70217.1 hypothetical protein RhiirC2_746938 [Rhizophagus irregularis]PKY15483.1 hypothetical protein RhiirB3_401672 [Rhizophagus irregularis]POG80707.1 hypothetical protein GLOIN_2v1514951 [Rhizophagus irregularis DAOM 181602=DAOM 197198]|eukprot:XP_025187573.1 hypothetical protein GLOIN_2v1514951 [Rhizophagus irregularis DAOM 181602=DAOM 197198]
MSADAEQRTYAKSVTTFQAFPFTYHSRNCLCTEFFKKLNYLNSLHLTNMFPIYTIRCN